MKAGRGMLSELCFAAEGLSGTAASSSLRKLGSVMERAPSGRLFDAISTLSDMSAKAARALEEGAQNIGRNDDSAAARITVGFILINLIFVGMLVAQAGKRWTAATRGETKP